MARGQTVTLKETPRLTIIEVAKSLDQVVVQVKRRNARGQLATVIGGVTRKTTDLIDGTVEEWIKSLAGGGTFRLETWAPQDPTTSPIPPYELYIEGQEKAIDRGQGPRQHTPLGYATGYTPQGGVFAPQQPPLSGWAAGLSPASQWSYWQSLQESEQPPAPGATIASDQMALHMHAEAKAHIARLEAEKVRAEERLVEAQERAQKDTKLLMERLEKMERDRSEERHRMEIQAIEQRLNTMTQLQQSKSSVSDYAPVLAAIAPVASAMIQGNKQATTKAQELQHQSLQQLLAQTSQKKDTDLPALIGAVAPMILQVLQNKGPEAQVALQQAMFDSAASQMAMTAQFVQTMAEMQSGGDQPPWWLPAVEGGIKGAMDILGTYAAMKEANKTDRVQGQISQPITSRGLPAPAPDPEMYQTYGVPGQQPPADAAQPQPGSNGASDKPAPEVVVKMIVASPRVPPQYKTPEWQLILHEIHREADIEETTELLVHHLLHCQRFQKLPPGLEQVFDDPDDAIPGLLQPLPVSSYAPEYTKNLAEAVIEDLKALREQVEDEDGEDEDEDDREPEDESQDEPLIREKSIEEIDDGPVGAISRPAVHVTPAPSSD